MLPLDIWKHLLNSDENRQQKSLIFLLVVTGTSVSRVITGALCFRPLTRLFFQIWLHPRPSHHFYFPTIWFTSFLSGSSPYTLVNYFLKKEGKKEKCLLRLGRYMEAKVKNMKETFGRIWKKAKDRNRRSWHLFWIGRTACKLPG